MNYDTFINLLHVFVIVPLIILLYNYRDKLTSLVCNIIIVISGIGMIYHLYKLVKNSQLTEQREFKMIINLIHIFLVFPLLIYIGLKCKDGSRRYYELLLILMFAALGYNLFNLIRYSIF
jgi:hypothetical protein